MLKRALCAGTVAIALIPAFSLALTQDDIQQQIQALLQQIAALQAQLQTGNTTTTTATGDHYCPSLTRSLYRGTRDATTQGQVTELQKFLAGYFTLAPSDIITGFFGLTTERYVLQFQNEQGITPTGTVGPLTRSRITQVCATATHVNNTTQTTTTNQPCTFNNQTVLHGSAVTAYERPSVPYGSFCLSEARSCVNGFLYGSYQYSSCTVTDQQNQSCAFSGQSIPHGTTVTAYESSSVPYNQTCKSQIRTCDSGTLSGTYTNTNCTVQTAPTYAQGSYYSQAGYYSQGSYNSYAQGSYGGGNYSFTFTATPASGASPLTTILAARTSYTPPLSTDLLNLIGAIYFDFGDGTAPVHVGAITWDFKCVAGSNYCEGGYQHTFTAPGTYTAKLTANGTILATVTITVQ